MSEGVDEIKDKDWIRAWSTRVDRGELVKGAADRLTHNGTSRIVWGRHNRRVVYWCNLRGTKLQGRETKGN